METVEDRIVRAEALLPRARALLDEDREARDLLARLDRALSMCAAEAGACGIVGLCKACEEEGGGFCCGAGIEARYDLGLLLVNRLLGVTLPRVRERLPRSCLFLGRDGCRLRVREVLCVNYLCPGAAARVPRDLLAALREREGEALELSLRLQARLAPLLHEDGAPEPREDPGGAGT